MVRSRQLRHLVKTLAVVLSPIRSINRPCRGKSQPSLGKLAKREISLLGCIGRGEATAPTILAVTMLCQKYTRSTFRAEFRLADEATVLDTVFRPLCRGIGSVSHHSSPPSTSSTSSTSTSPASSLDSVLAAAAGSALTDASSPSSSDMKP